MTAAGGGGLLHEWEDRGTVHQLSREQRRIADAHLLGALLYVCGRNPRLRGAVRDAMDAAIRAVRP